MIEIALLEKQYIKMRDAWYTADDQDEELCRTGQISKDEYLTRCQQREAHYRAKFATLQAQVTHLQSIKG